MLTFQIGNTTIHFLPLLIVLAILTFITIFTYIVQIKQINSMKNLCMCGNYEKSNSLAQKLLTYYTRSYKLYRVKRTKIAIDNLHTWLAISYLGMSKYDKFWEHINKVEQKNNSTYCWIATYYVLKKDMEQIRLYKEKIEPTEETKNTVALLDGILLCEEGNVTEGKAILNEILPKLNFELSKKIVLDYTK